MSTTKAREVLKLRVTEAAAAVLQHNGVEILNSILDHVDPEIIGRKALKSPVVKRWVVKLVREGLGITSSVEVPEEEKPDYTLAKGKVFYYFTRREKQMEVVGFKETKILPIQEARSLYKYLLSRGYRRRP